ncbi:hypothetical protein [Aureliella helgolandensis]|uniref:Uncharacterized protein n=1 Tax=Aureliella helgolandensis TaxID=2527968 RepID=A0A518G0H4_9BACT|nr:hypothetical protein [Aureliella helgolandensis]QDV22101.1 hypothetical protein Q31a_03840 [Aureliella helgolandensis]
MGESFEYQIGAGKFRSQQEQILAHLVDKQLFAINSIKGPYDACLVDFVRQLVLDHLKIGSHQWSDVFLLGTKPSFPRTLYTQLGGEPISGGGAIGRNGEPLPLIAQLDFRFSRDICKFVETDILQVFGEPESGEELVCRWVKLDEKHPVNTSTEFHATSLKPCLYAWYRWRTPTFPSWSAKDGSEISSVNLPSGKFVVDLDFFLQPLALQIGMFPIDPPGGLGELLTEDECIIATIPTIYAQSEQVWEFADQSSPIAEDEAERLSFVLGGRELGYAPLGVIYVIGSESCGIRAEFIEF